MRNARTNVTLLVLSVSVLGAGVPLALAPPASAEPVPARMEQPFDPVLDPRACLAPGGPEGDGGRVKSAPTQRSPSAVRRACAERFLRPRGAADGPGGAPSRPPELAKAVRRDEAEGGRVPGRAGQALEDGSASNAPPSNDNFATRTTIATTPYTDAQDTAEATTEVGEQQPSCADVGRTVWYQFTPASNMTLQADTFGSDFDTVVAVWTGPALGALTQVACNDDIGSGLTSAATFAASSGTTYLFQVGGFFGEYGNLTFNLGPPTLGSISGIVSDAATGAPLELICVDVYDAVYGDWFGYGLTNASGQYLVGGLATGSYKLAFYDCNWPARYLWEWYNNRPDWATADPVGVAAPATTTGIDAGLVLGASISGTVTDEATGAPVQDICIDVYDSSEEWVGWADSLGSGQYAAHLLPSGTYRVVFYDCYYWPPRYGLKWYNDKPTFGAADPVIATAPNTTSGIDAAMGGFLLLVGRTGTGSGMLTSTPAGIDCGGVCWHRYPYGTAVVIHPVAAPGSEFSGWGGGCAGIGVCIVTMRGTRFVTADFTATAQATHGRSVSLALKKHLVAKGKVSSSSEACVTDATVEIQRKRNGGWKTVKKAASDDTGAFKAKMKDRPGMYRAMVEQSDGAGVVCEQGTSPSKKHGH